MNENHPKLRLENDQKCLKVVWSENHIGSFYCKWIRFHCRCDRCLKPYTGIYLVERTKFSDKFIFTNVQKKGENLVSHFNEDIFDEHETTIPLDWLLKNCNCQKCLDKELDRREITEFSIPNEVEMPIMNQEEIKTKEGRFRCIDNVLRRGFCLIKGVATEDKQVVNFAEQFGYLVGSAYGPVWDIKLEAKPYNFSHTAVTQTLHQDLPGYESEPGVQYLHAYRFDEQVIGGESMIVDLFMVANKLRQDSPKLFDALTRIPACFSVEDYERDEPLYQMSMKPHIELDYHGRIIAIHWQPGSEGTLRVREEDMAIYYEAHNAFKNILDQEQFQYIYRMNPGELLMLNNRRVAHARKGFDLNGGMRCLQGVYTNLDELKSMYMTLANELNIDAIPIKVGNRSSF